jgi:hypothetical protein
MVKTLHHQNLRLLKTVGGTIMKRWWNTSNYPATARVTRRRVGRALMRVAVAGAVSLPVARPATIICTNTGTCCLGSFCWHVYPTPARTGGAVIQAWAIGTLSSATHPNSQDACDFDHLCELAISSTGGVGTGTGTTIKTSFQSPSQIEPSPNLPFGLVETIDYGHPVTKGVHGEGGGDACYPANGAMAIAVDASSTLVLDIVGQACQVGNSSAQLVFTGSYITDAASSGTVANADGIGSVNINTPSGLPGTGTTLKASLMGQLIYGN